MRFTISRDLLIKPLQTVSGVVEKRQTLPILSNILLQVGSDRLSMTGTDLEVELVASVALDNATPGEITLPGRKFMDICKALPENALIELAVDSDKAMLKAGKSRFTLLTLPATDYPATEAIKGSHQFVLSQKQLKSLIDQTQFSMANQDVRYYLNGLLLEIENGSIRMVATDGHRLALSEISTDIAIGDKRQVIIPRKGVLELSRLLATDDTPCTIQLNQNHIRISLGDTIFTSKLVDGRFPDYERVIPKGGDKVIRANRMILKDGLQRTAILSNEKYRGIRLTFKNNTLIASVNNPEHEEAEDELPIEYTGQELEIGFNVSYLLDVLNVIKQEEVEIVLADSSSSCLMMGAGDAASRYVVMPMRL
ncbi:MAG TPA: DNA polymerase III subunit beta [Gammaproteobacteria bacterium]